MRPPAEVVAAYLAAVQEARRGRGADEAWQRVAGLLAADARWRFAGAGGALLWPVEWGGRDQIMVHLKDPMASWTRLRTETLAVLSCGPVVLVEQVTTVVDPSGEVAVKPVAHVFTVNDGRISQIRTYRNDAVR